MDAVGHSAGGVLLLSFDTSVALGGSHYDDEDLVRYDGLGFALALDASAVGFDPALDLDAVHEQDGGAFAVGGVRAASGSR